MVTAPAVTGAVALDFECDKAGFGKRKRKAVSSGRVDLQRSCNL